jgi:hypothetical protein
MVLSYLHEQGHHKAVKKFAKALKLGEKPSFLPKGTLAAAVAGTRKNARKRKARERTTPRTAYELFVLDRKDKFNLPDGAERRKLVRSEWENATPTFQAEYKVKQLKLKEEYYIKNPDKRPKLKPTTVKARRSHIDPKRPKKPKTSYILFTLDARAGVTQQHPEWKATEVMVHLGGLWNKMTDSEKEDYRKKYVVSKAQYDIAMNAYVPDPAYAVPPKYNNNKIKDTDSSTKTYDRKRRDGTRKDKNAPKRVVSNYLLFQRRERLKLKTAEYDTF